MGLTIVIKKILKLLYNIPAKIKLKSLGKNSILFWPGEIENGQYMTIEDNCYIKSNFWLQAIKLERTPKFVMGTGSYINRFCQIVITGNVTIGKNVTIADNVYIADTTHGYNNPTKAVSAQDLEYVGDVEIGDGSWIGRSASIMGCKIGKGCIIGTGAFVKKNIPDYCVAVGSPARIIKRYSFETQKWENTDKDGNFL